LECAYDPADDLLGQVFKSVGGKIAASSRQRPSVLQLLFSFDRVVSLTLQTQTRTAPHCMSCVLLRATQHSHFVGLYVSAGPVRKSRPDVLAEEIKKYNSKATARAHKINSDEISAVRFLAGGTPEFLKLLKIIWGTDKLQHTSITLSMLSAAWLNRSSELAVTQKDNPTWYSILQVTPQKLEFWLRRADGRFAVRVRRSHTRDSQVKCELTF
jgi:hypothetical protein